MHWDGESLPLEAGKKMHSEQAGGKRRGFTGNSLSFLCEIGGQLQREYGGSWVGKAVKV